MVSIATVIQKWLQLYFFIYMPTQDSYHGLQGLILKLNDHKLHYVGMSVCGAGGVWVAKGLQSNLELLHILIVE